MPDPTYGVTWGEGDGPLAVPEDVTTSVLAYLTSDLPTSSTIFTNITGLTFPVSAGKTYALRAFIIYETSSSGEAGDFAVAGPAGVSQTMLDIIQFTAISTLRQVYVNAYNTGAGTTTGPGATPAICIIEGIVTISGSNGTLALRYKTETGGGESTTAKAGSYATLRLIA